MYKIASRSQRFFSFVIDYCIVLLISTLIGQLIGTVLGVGPTVINKLLEEYQNTAKNYADQLVSAEEYLAASFAFLGVYLIYLSILSVLNIVLTFLYRVFMTAFCPFQTFGRLLLKCKAIPVNGEKMSFGKVVIREFLLFYALFDIFGIVGMAASAIVCNMTGTVKSIIDIITKTRLIDTRVEKQDTVAGNVIIDTNPVDMKPKSTNESVVYEEKPIEPTNEKKKSDSEDEYKIF